MGGSDPGRYAPPPRDYGAADETERDCFQLKFKTDLQMTDGEVAREVGAVLEVLEVPVVLSSLTVSSAVSLEESPIEDAVAGQDELSVQESLSLVPVEPEVSVPLVTAIDDDGNIVGTITDQTPDLIRCMDQGVAYVAEVLDNTANVNKVWIRPAETSRAAQTYDVDGEITVGTFDVEVRSRSDQSTDVIAGANTLSRENICELRSLLRVSAEFDARVDPSGDAEVSLK